MCPGIKEDIKLLHKLLGCYKTTSFQFLTLNTVTKYALLVQPINFQGYFESKEQEGKKKKKTNKPQNLLLMRKKPHSYQHGKDFLFKLIQTLLLIQLKKLNRLRHDTYCIFNIFKIQFD